MVVQELECTIKEQSKEIKALKENNCKLENINNDLARQQEILFKIVNELLNNEIDLKEFQYYINLQVSNIINNALNNNLNTTKLLTSLKNVLDNEQKYLFRLSLILMEFNCNYIPDKKTKLILFSA